ncbi:hypothetical protein H5P28_16945 [Ruficoccus amylovorans]|uniref:Uncharacterized protein n=1 Tax=Ruficoccus amylovorans TaxID=1804625 RepID=A0A842HGV9_9BACT|nr:hypothetical protein [Ruficoccus amylovorans]MBC2595955.1 hypothetical protein [Ruficoccus amylovorans]
MKTPTCLLRGRSCFCFSALLLCLIATICLLGCSEQPKKPELPVHVSFRQSVLGKGKVVIFSNTSNKLLSPVVYVENRTLRERYEFYFIIEPHRTVEIGVLEVPWDFLPGEYMKISHDGYSNKYLKVP